MGQIASGAIDALFGGTPSVNPDFVKGGYKFKNGIPVDSDGNPTTIMTQPNLAQRMLSSTARARAEQNANLSSQFALMGPEANARMLATQNAQLGAANNLVGMQPSSNNPYANSRFNLPEDAQGPLSPDEQSAASKQAWASSLVNPMLEPSNVATQQRSQGAIGSGTLSQTGGFEAGVQNKAAKFQDLIGSGNLTDADLLLKTMHNQKMNDYAIANKIDPQKIAIWNEQFKREKGRLPTIQDAEDNRAAIDKANTGAMVGALPKTTQTIGINADTGLAGAQTENALTHQRSSDVGLIGTAQHLGTINAVNGAQLENTQFPIRAGTQQMEDAKANYAASMFEDPNTGISYPARVNQYDGQYQVLPNTGQFNPSYRSPAMTGMNAIANGGSMGAKVESAPGGTTLMFAPQGPEPADINTGTVKPVGLVGQPTINGHFDEAQQDIKDRKDKANKAALKQHQAEIDAKVKALQAKKAEAEKNHHLNSLYNEHIDTTTGSILYPGLDRSAPPEALANPNPIQPINPGVKRQLVGQQKHEWEDAIGPSFNY